MTDDAAALPHDAPDQQAVLRSMRHVADVFYSICQSRDLSSSGVDGFFSLSGLISKYVSVYEKAAARGEAVLLAQVRAQPYDMEYLAEKFGRIFGPLIGSAATLRLFIEKLRLHAMAPDRAQWVCPAGPPNDHLISSVQIVPVGTHELVRIWNRGGLAGELTVLPGDGARIAEAFGLERKHSEPDAAP